MKQLVNKYDRRIRLVGLEDVLIEGKTGEALGERPRLYYRFAMPMGSGDVECLWSGQDWALEEVTRQGESKAFRDWLRKKIAEKGYSAYGLSMSMGYSSSWMGNFLNGKSRLRERDLPRLAKELGVSESYLRAKRARSATIRQDV